MAEVKIRDLDAAVVKQLDQLAREKDVARKFSAAISDEHCRIGGKQSSYWKTRRGVPKNDNRNHRINERCSTIINRNS